MKDVVAFVHSTGTGPALFRGVPASAVGDRTAIYHGNLGYPPAPLIPRGTHVSVQDDVAALLRRLPDGPRIHLVCHSYGGLVGLLAAQELGSRIASMFLYEPVVFQSVGEGTLDAEVANELRTFDENPWFLEDEARGGGPEWMEIFIDYWNRPGTWASFPELMREGLLLLGWKMFMEVRSCFGQTMRLSEWSLPGAVTIAHGGRSPASSRAMARGLAAGRANVRLVALPQLGHMAPLTEPEPVHEAIAHHFHSAADF